MQIKKLFGKRQPQPTACAVSLSASRIAFPETVENIR